MTAIVAVSGLTSLVGGLFLIYLGLWQEAFAMFSLGMMALIILSFSIYAHLLQRIKMLRERIQGNHRIMVKEMQAINHVPMSQDKVKPEDRLVPIGNNLGGFGPYGGIGPVFEFAERASRNRGGLETFALRSRSSGMRDVFARAATNMQYDAEDTLRFLRCLRAGRSTGSDIVATWDNRLLLAFARILANQRILPGDLEDAEVVFNAVVRVFGYASLGKTDVYVYAETLSAIRRYVDAARLLRSTKIANRDPVHYKLFLANSIADNKTPDWAQWISRINDLYDSNNLANVSLGNLSREFPIDSLVTDLPSRSVDGPLISVIVPTYNGSRFLETTLNCLICQSWRNLEIIVVDDGSDEKHKVEIIDICSRFSDVTLLHLSKNQGVYVARNHALEHAAGEFITVHDDDDWSHGQKLEMQVRNLLDNPHQLANMTRHARITDESLFTRINNNPSFSQPNFSSLMFRKDLVSDLGKWDQANRGADAEFRDRIVAFSGCPVPVLFDIPLSFTRTHIQSLTSGEINRGYIDPSRLFYQAAYQEAHRELEGISPGEPLEFVKPLSLLPGKRGQNLGNFDVVFATDFSFPGGTTNLTLNEVEAAATAGYNVGIVNMISPVNAGASAPTLRTLDVVKRFGVSILSLSDIAHIGLLVIRHVSVVQFIENLSSSLRVDRMVIIINNPPVLMGGRGYISDFGTAIKNVETVFGITPTLMSESGVTQAQCKKLARSFELAEEIWPGFVDQDVFVPKTPMFKRKAVLGRHSRDAVLKWPSSLDVIRSVYVSNDIYDVKILGGIESLDGRAKESLFHHAEVLGFDSLPVCDFLKSLDFWVYFHNESLTESFGMAIVEAMSCGLVVILPPYMEQNFGEAALYARPEEVGQVVSKYWANPDLYLNQSNKAIDTVQRIFSKEAFLQRVEGFMPKGVTESCPK